MRTFKFIVAGFILALYTFSWSAAGVHADYAQDDQNKTVLKEAVVGAGVGAVSSGASGGNAGKGALIGAGTNVIGNALLNTLTSSPQPAPAPQVQYVQQAPERPYAPVDMQPRRGGCGRGR